MRGASVRRQPARSFDLVVVWILFDVLVKRCYQLSAILLSIIRRPNDEAKSRYDAVYAWHFELNSSRPLAFYYQLSGMLLSILMSFYPRYIRSAVVDRLSEMRVVCILGPRQAGKTTLVKLLSQNEYQAEYVSLDVEAVRLSAIRDPDGFVSGHHQIVIDEIQRAPNLMLAIKNVVDQDNRRGQFLLTGSANITTVQRIADALPGRVGYVSLWPLSQCEIQGTRSEFLSRAFKGDVARVSNAPIGESAYTDIVVKGGFPESLLTTARARISFFEDYSRTVLGREVGAIAEVRDIETVHNVLKLVAARSACLTNYSTIGQIVGAHHHTVKTYLRILEQLFLVIELAAWHPNQGKRLTRASKLHLADTGMLCALNRIDEQTLALNPASAGSVFETFAVNEIIRQATFSELIPGLRFYHFRDPHGHEVDLVLEHANGDIVGIEVKSASQPQLRDLKGLEQLRQIAKNRFKCGIVLYRGERTLPFGDRIWAVPFSGLWE